MTAQLGYTGGQSSSKGCCMVPVMKSGPELLGAYTLPMDDLDLPTVSTVAAPPAEIMQR